MSSEEELWQTYSSNGQAQNKAVRPSLARSDDSIIEGAVHVWIWRKSEIGLEILLQQRAHDKVTFPGMYDISAAGHVDANETLLEAVKRECKEEINLDIDPKVLEYVFSYRNFKSGIKWVYLYRLINNVKFVLNDGEVESLQWVPFEKFTEMALAPQNHGLVQHPPEYFSLLLKAFKHFDEDN